MRIGRAKKISVVSKKIAEKNGGCENCQVGKTTLYGRTFRTSPSKMSIIRLGVQHFGARQTIFAAGEVPSKISTLRTGWAFRSYQLSNGRRHIMSFLVPGDLILVESLIGLNYALPYAVKSLTPVTLCNFAITDMLQIMMATPPQHHDFSQGIERYWHGLSRRDAALARRSALGRVAHLILELDSRLSRRGLADDHNFEFPLRQEHIADATGLTFAHVNRVLSEMRKKDLVKLAPRRMKIIDYQRLVDIAEEC